MKVNVLIPGHLRLTCTKCTRVAGFAADTPEAAAALAQRAGWINDGEQVVCARCPGTRPVYLPTPAEAYAAAMIGNVESAL